MQDIKQHDVKLIIFTIVNRSKVIKDWQCAVITCTTEDITTDSW